MKSLAKTPAPFSRGSNQLKFVLRFLAGTALSCSLFAGAALADTLELKTGEIIQGRFVGGSPLNIRFEINGKEQIFPTKDVLNIGFSDSGDAYNAPAQPADQQTESPAPPSAAQPQAPAPTPAQATPQANDALPAAPAPNLPARPSMAQSSAQSVQAITVPAGTSLLIRMIDDVDSSTSKVGDPFQASLERDLVVGNTLVAPRGADVFGELQQAKSAGKISGAAQLTLALTGIRINGKMVPINSTTYDVAGKSRGTQSAERIGGGAVVGAIIGAVAGGGRGAAIGAGVGAGAGTAVQVMTHGDQVRIPSETLLEFTLEQDVTAPVSNASN